MVDLAFLVDGPDLGLVLAAFLRPFLYESTGITDESYDRSSLRQ